MNTPKTGNDLSTRIMIISIFVMVLALAAFAAIFPKDGTKSKADVPTTTVIDIPLNETIVYRVHYINNRGKEVSDDVLTFILPNGSICQRTEEATSVFQCGGASTYVE